MEIADFLKDSYMNSADQQIIHAGISLEDVLIGGGFAALLGILASYTGYKCENGIDDRTAIKEFCEEIKVNIAELSKYFGGIG